MGLVDRAHLRWFKRDAMRAEIEGAKLMPLEVAPRRFDQECAAAAAKAAEPLLRAMGGGAVGVAAAERWGAGAAL